MQAFSEDVDKFKDRLHAWWPIIKTTCGVFIVLTFITGTLVLLSKFQEKKEFSVHDQIYMSPTRDYKLVPFDILDATHYCQAQTQDKYGDRLAMTYVDEHSTRLDEGKGLYKIFLIAHVGDLNQYQETSVHCFVDQYRYKLTHYRTVKLKDTGLISRALSFFGK